jgi:hypothetical protein
MHGEKHADEGAMVMLRRPAMMTCADYCARASGISSLA